MYSLLLDGGGMSGAAAEYLERMLIARKEERERSRRGTTMLMHGRMPENKRAEVRSQLSFLEGCREFLHGIVIIGSTAHASDETGSDIDIVIVCQKKGKEIIQNALFDREMDDISGSGRSGPDYTLLTLSQVRKLFRMGSPFAYALCSGLVLEDDGCLGSLLKRRPGTPGRKYALTAMFESIIVPYYGSFRSLHARAYENKCSAECCSNRQAECEGLSSKDTAVKVLVRMLYVTLPLRGFMPVTKNDLIAFTEKIYGRDNAEIVRRAVSVARNDVKRISYADYLQFRRLAGSLFREILIAVGIDRTVSKMLSDGASVVQGKYGQIKEANLGRCVMN